MREIADMIVVEEPEGPENKILSISTASIISALTTATVGSPQTQQKKKTLL